MISAIACMDEFGGIGKAGTLPWGKDKTDLAFFKDFTKDATVIMGRKCYEDEAMPKPLKGRLNVVVGSTRAVDYDYDLTNTLFWTSLDYGILKFFTRPILIGGAMIYNEAIRAKAIDVFVINVKPGYYGCDTFIDTDCLDKNYSYIESPYPIRKGQSVSIRIYTKRKT